MTGVDLPSVVERFLDNPVAAEFCAVHRVLEQFEYRGARISSYFQALPIPDSVRQAHTLAEIAAIFDVEPQALIAVNDWILGCDAGDDRQRSAPERRRGQHSRSGLRPDSRGPVRGRSDGRGRTAAGRAHADDPTACANRAAEPNGPDTVLGRLILSTRDQPEQLPAMLRDLPLPDEEAAGELKDSYRLGVL